MPTSAPNPTYTEAGCTGAPPEGFAVPAADAAIQVADLPVGFTGQVNTSVDAVRHVEKSDPSNFPKGLIPSQEFARPTDGAIRRAFEAMDDLEVGLMGLPPVEMPLTHAFTPGLYIRTIFMPAGTLLTSKIHKTQHPFVITRGRVTVFDPEGGSVELSAGHMGITQPGTRRVLYTHEDTVWSTFHVTTETDPEKIEATITEARSEHLRGLTRPAGPALDVIRPMEITS